MQEALIYNTLYGFRVKMSKEKENNKHYLYDIDETPLPAKEFTEDDLKPDESVQNDQWEY